MIPTKPPGVFWTDEQWRSIYLRGKNILVSAGAGSGKTAVLTERVFQRIKEGINVNELLVVTFTKAAALEMKERIRHRIIKGIDAGETHLFKQLNLLETAHISTFDSFSMSVVKKYGYLLNIDRDIQIGDAIEIKRLKDQLMDQFIEEKHRQKDADFIHFIRRYSLKDGKPVRTLLDQLTDHLLKRPDYQAILKKDLNQYHSASFYDTLHQLKANYIQAILSQLNDRAKIIALKFAFHPVIDHVKKIEEALFKLSKITDQESLRVNLLSFKLPTAPRNIFSEEEAHLKEALKDEKEIINNTLKTVKELVHHDPVTVQKIMDDNQPFETTILTLAGEFIERYFAFQIQSKTFDYASIAMLSIRLIREFEGVKDALKNQFKEILVDEYQDTSPLQDELIEGIAHQNLYVVGDIKQSIYRFRGAEPKIFQDKYRTYYQDENSEVIHLTANFRSRKEVVDDINAFFQLIFDETYGGVDYQDHHMHFGLEHYLSEKANASYGLNILSYDEALAADEERSTPGKRTLASLEAEIIIKDLLKRHENDPIYDKDENRLRAARYDDFVILIDRKTYFDEFKDAFQAYNVPLHIHQSDTFLSNVDVLVTINLFKLLLSLSSEALFKEHFKHAFLSLAYSYLFDFTTDEIIAFYLKTDVKDPNELFKVSQYTVFEPVFEVFKKLLEEKEYLTLHELLMRFNTSFNLLEKALKLDYVSAIEERLIFIFEQLRAFDEKQFSLEDLMDYFSYAITHHKPNHWFFNIDIDYVRGTAVVKDKVNLMTIHHSKGLEFPVVYYPNTFASWKKSDEGVRFSDDYGLLMDAEHDGLIKTLATFIDDDRHQKESLSERLRLLYVALTRAREAMVILHPDKKPLAFDLATDENGQIYPAIRSVYQSYLDITESVLPMFKDRQTPVDPSLFETSLTPEKISKETLLNQPAKETKNTYHVLEKASEEPTHYQDETIAFIPPDAMAAMQMGSEVHEILKYINFHQPINSQLTQLDIKEPYMSLIENFFNQPFLNKRLEYTVYKELPFVYASGETLIRGIIDCVLEGDDEIIIIDYKMRSIEEEAYIDQVLRYVKYLHHKTNKPVSGYLYSLVNQTFKTVVEDYQNK